MIGLIITDDDWWYLYTVYEEEASHAPNQWLMIFQSNGLFTGRHLPGLMMVAMSSGFFGLVTLVTRDLRCLGYPKACGFVMMFE